MAGTSAEGGGAGAIEKRCPICLEDFDDKTFIDACFHCFCFRCIVQWSQVTTTCPMCKTSFTTLIHRVQANDDYIQYKVEPKTRTSDQEISIGEARRFRYRTTRVPGQPRYSAPEPPDQQETAGERERRERERQKRRITSQLQSNPASDERRRAVYSLGLLAQPPRTEEKKERVRNISAAFFRKNPACTHRLVPWLTREIRVLLGPDHVQFIIQLVLSLIDKVELEGEEFHKHIQPFLLTRTSHFLHELVSFARSPFNMAAYDHRVRYEWPLSRVRDDWDPEATVNVTTEQLQHSPRPGPSGNSLSDQIQERMFDELTATGWDDSPPFLQLSSPILVHGSDSEDGEDTVHTLLDSVSTSNTSTSTAMHKPPLSTSGTSSATFGDCARTDDATLTGDTTAGGVGRYEERGHVTCVEGGRDGESGDGGEGTQEDECGSKKDNFREVTVKQNDEGEQNHPPSPGDVIRKSDDASSSAVSATAPNALLRQVQPTLNDKSMLLNTPSITSCSSSVKCKSEVQDEEEMCIVINAESDSEYLPLETVITGNTGSSGLSCSKLKGNESAMKTTSRDTCKGKAPSRERGSLENKKHKSRKERDKGKMWKHSHKKHKRRQQLRSDDGKWHSESQHKRSKHNLDRCYNSSDSSSDLERQRFSPESKREKKHRQTHRWPRFREVELYYTRERCHRSRLYSDDFVYSKTESEHRIRHRIRGTVTDKEGVSAGSNTARVSVDDKKIRRKSQCDAECNARYSVNRDSEKLRKELSGLDQEIVEQKREALRAMLRCERLKLLHRELQGKDLPEGELCSLGQPQVINETTPTGEVEQQLAELDKAIMDGKRRVLHIMKKMEEQAPQSDDSSN